MRILFLTHSFNSLSQKLYVTLKEQGHSLSVEFDINDDVLRSAVTLFKPDIILAPFLKRAIPSDIWTILPCMIVHPGIAGDRGPSALDWAILKGEREWGVTVLQANDVWDGGPIWSEVRFAMPLKPKGQVYRHELAMAAERAVLTAIEAFKNRKLPVAQNNYPDLKGNWHEPIRDSDRTIDWQQDSTETVLRKIYSADGEPGAIGTIDQQRWRLFDAHLASDLIGFPGEVIATSGSAIALGCLDGAVWVGHLAPADRKLDDMGRKKLKLPALSYLSNVTVTSDKSDSFSRIKTHRVADTAFLYFDFYNGAMNTGHCLQLKQEVEALKSTQIKRLVLMGGSDFWSNGLHLNCIENADSPAQASLENIEAMNDLCETLIRLDNIQVASVLRGNAGAGGVYLALAADFVLAGAHITLNPHYKSMGNLYGSEYWTYLLPRRLSETQIEQVMNHRLPMGASEAKRLGLIDDVLPFDVCGRESSIIEWLDTRTTEDFYLAKKQRRAADESRKPLQRYRTEELEQMKLNFFGFDPSYHVARYHFVHKTPKSRTPLYLANHRQLANAPKKPTPVEHSGA